MRNPERIDVMLEELSLLWKMYPDLRLGQLIEIVKFQSGSKADTFNIEDDVLFKGIKSFKSDLEAIQ